MYGLAVVEAIEVLDPHAVLFERMQMHLILPDTQPTKASPPSSASAFRHRGTVVA